MAASVIEECANRLQSAADQVGHPDYSLAEFRQHVYHAVIQLRALIAEMVHNPDYRHHSEIEPCSIEGMISSHRRLQGAQEGMAAGIELAARYCETCKVYSTVGQYYAKQLHTLKNAAPQGNEREGAQSKAVAVQPQLGPQSPDLAGSTPDAPAVAAPKDTTAGSSARQPEALQAQGDDTTVRGVAPAAGVPLDKPLSVHDHGNCELCDQLESELVQAMRALNAAGEAIEHLESLTASARDIGLPRGWSLRREGDGIVVSHEQEGAVFVREDTSRSLAECILFYLADDLMDPALPRRYTRTDSTGQKP